MPDLHMSFFTPSDLLRLEQDTAWFIRGIKQSLTRSASGVSDLVIDFELAGKNAFVKGARWHFTMNDGSCDVSQCFRGTREPVVIEAPSNMAWRDYMELLFLKVSHGLGAELLLDMRSFGLRHQIVLEKSQG